MRRTVCAVVLSCAISACGAAPNREGASAPGPAPLERPATQPEPELSAEAALKRADELYLGQLATAARDERYALDRQLSALREAVVHYDRFLESARDDAATLILIQRSRERRKDAEETIAALERSLAAEPAAASAP